ncbi:MAG: NERD domain-containing protein [Clostridia bacterium]|nr:NERD domain-containing protein [Clostridia bacterium]
MSNLFKTIVNRSFGAGLPTQEEIERFGADGEEAVYRLLCENFDCVIRNVVVPHKKLYLEKDFLVLVKGVPFVLEIKNWKGEIGRDGDNFYQNKENGTRKTIKSPVGTTNQFVRCMKEFYKIGRPVYGVVVFAEPDCKLSLPEELDGVALITAEKMVSHLRARARSESKGLEPIDTERILRCTRFYSFDREFSKGILADTYLDCTAENGDRVRLDTTYLRYLTVEHQPLRLRDKLYVTYTNGTTGVFYNRDLILTVGCLDGSYRKLALNRIRHIVF